VTELRRQALGLVRTLGYERRAEPFRLASGQTSFDYVDAKHAIARGSNALAVGRAVLELAGQHGIGFTAVGGLTMGADALAVAVSIAADCQWFAVRKEPKARGREQWIEGHRLGPEDRVLLVDDVVTTGGSIWLAHDRVAQTGATVAGVVPLLDRGDSCGPRFAAAGIPYAPLLTYRDLGIAPVAAHGQADAAT
jgi:orotate phosphoribosyltransferase